MHKLSSICFIDFENYKCKICNKLAPSMRSLGNHLAKTHKISSSEEYFLKYELGDISPVCLCGCGEKTNWHKTQHRFVDYISGHNDTGFDISTYKPTKEQVQKRGDSIKKTYEERGEEINARISKSVIAKYRDDVIFKQEFKDTLKEAWTNPDLLERMSLQRKKYWADNHDDLCKKIFTPEMRKKISLSNRKRDFQRVSKEELKFYDFLKTIFDESNILHSRWINFDSGSKCFDFYLINEKILIEFDGIYWHARDRKENFTRDQIVNLSADFHKELLIREKKYSLLRISSDVDFSNCKNLKDLENIAYHFVKNGEVIKDGLFKFENDEHLLISKESLIKGNSVELGGSGKEWTEKELKPYILQFLKNYCKVRGWIYPVDDLSADLKEIVQEIKDNLPDLETKELDEGFAKYNGGGHYLQAIFKSFWHTQNGPIDSFWDDNVLDKVLSYRLGLNTSKPYTYKLSDGSKYTCNETFDINPKTIRKGFIVRRAAVSWFKPGIAAWIYKKYLGDIINPVIYDPSCGFGARMLGFFALYPEGTYVGTDPAKQTYSDLLLLKNNLNQKLNIKDFQVDIRNQGSEDVKLENNSLDLVFTSPPYFDKEKYFDEDTQCWKKYNKLESWTENYLYPTLLSCFNALKNNKKMVINIDEMHREIVLETAKRIGFNLVDELFLIRKRDHFHKKINIDKPFKEPILVFLKGV